MLSPDLQGTALQANADVELRELMLQHHDVTVSALRTT
jgi:hypothetical protein